MPPGVHFAPLSLNRGRRGGGGIGRLKFWVSRMIWGKNGPFKFWEPIPPLPLLNFFWKELHSFFIILSLLKSDYETLDLKKNYSWNKRILNWNLGFSNSSVSKLAFSKINWLIDSKKKLSKWSMEKSCHKKVHNSEISNFWQFWNLSWSFLELWSKNHKKIFNFQTSFLKNSHKKSQNVHKLVLKTNIF